MKMSEDDLIKELELRRAETSKLSSDRNYTQMERDMIEKFYKNTQQKIEKKEQEIFLKESEMQKMEENHRLDIRMYLQKVKHLELEKQKNQEIVVTEGQGDTKDEKMFHQGRIGVMKDQKIGLKRDYHVKDRDNEEEVADKEKSDSNVCNSISVQNQVKLDDLELEYKKELDNLKRKLDLKLKVEIHEIEERKNKHINDLMANHEHSFAELKKFYNQITAENLDLIKTQKEEMKKIHDRRAQNSKQINSLKETNETLRNPLRKARIEKKILLHTLKQYSKDQLSLANLKVKLVALNEKCAKLEKNKEELDKRYTTVAEEREDLINRFDKIAHEMKRNTEIQNYILDTRLHQRESELQAKEGRLQEIVATSRLDPHYINDITARMRETLEEKNNEIKNLKYLIHHATKAYNDAIRVYEAKLVEFGIHPQELGFQPIESITSTMPAGLVSS